MVYAYLKMIFCSRVSLFSNPLTLLQLECGHCFDDEYMYGNIPQEFINMHIFYFTRIHSLGTTAEFDSPTYLSNKGTPKTGNGAELMHEVSCTHLSFTPCKAPIC